MHQIVRTTGAAIALAASVSAQADFVPGAPIIVPSDNVIVTLEFVGAFALHTGELTFLGAGTETEITRFATDSGIAGLGQLTFINHAATSGPVTLEGEFNAGEVLHFGYRVFEPSTAADILRSDTTETAGQFAWDAAASRIGVEDLRPDHPWYDADYNDIVVQVSFITAPTPGPLALLACAGLTLRRRRRA